VLGLIRNSGVEPRVIEYLKNPPAAELVMLLAQMGITPRQCCAKRHAFPRTGLDDPKWRDDEMIDAMLLHPSDNRPIVVTPLE